MSFKKFILKSVLPSCLRPKNPSSESRCPASKQISSRRLSLSDLSNSSVSLMSDLSNSLVGSNLHIFTLKELKSITDNFSKSSILGEGGFGQVYKGFIDDKLRTGLEPQPVAVKVLDLDGKQGHSATLPWLTRLQIAVGAAKGLTFLHEEEKPVIYRDFKASNILLDSDFTAKLSDFGLAIDGPEGDETHVTTRVMGTQGYAAPEYIMTGHVTSMSDVFSFGVVLLELLTGRRCLDKNRPNREQNLVDWAKPFMKDSHKVDRIMDPRLEGQYSSEGARKAATLAYHCLSQHPKSRPTMSCVVKTLQPLLDLTHDISIPFVYVVPNDERKAGSREGKQGQVPSVNECQHVGMNGKQDGKETEAKGKGHRRSRKGYRHKHRIRSLRSNAVFSDTALYRTLGTGLYSPK
ncbi:hypothetical protein TIFTF001_006351 [Ficus carica]|uniref:Protein kinase domain-containing protein n=1 Tax=Ficus carica TaxID=3494 RepID=A0AA88A089_FICCA|nr:hypothetical protein TIFTF001_006351 [Ficus carica]